VQLVRGGEAHERGALAGARRRAAHGLPRSSPRAARVLELRDARVGERRLRVVVLDQEGERGLHGRERRSPTRCVDERHQPAHRRSRSARAFGQREAGVAQVTDGADGGQPGRLFGHQAADQRGRGRLGPLPDAAEEDLAVRRLGLRGVMVDDHRRVIEGAHAPVQERGGAGRQHLRPWRAPAPEQQRRGRRLVPGTEREGQPRPGRPRPCRRTRRLTCVMRSRCAAAGPQPTSRREATVGQHGRRASGSHRLNRPGCLGSLLISAALMLVLLLLLGVL
jgi:hypothetical protein